MREPSPPTDDARGSKGGIGGRGTARWIFAAIAFAMVAAIVLWSGSSRLFRSRGGAAGRGDRDDATSAGGGGGIGQRHATTAAFGRVRADIVDRDGAPLDGGTVVLRCLTGDDAVLFIDGGTVEIDEHGHFEGPACRGQVCVELHHAGYVAAEPWVLQAEESSTLVARTLDVVRGEVVDAAGRPVIDATIAAIAPPDAEDPLALVPLTTTSTTSDADGAFAFSRIARPPCDPCRELERSCADVPLPVHDRFVLYARAPGHAATEVVVDLDRDDDPITIMLPDIGEPLTGRVVDPEGRAYPRAYVLARSIDRPAEQHRAEVDPTDGHFVLAELGEGEYRLRAIQEGVELAAYEAAAAGDDLELVGEATTRDLVVQVDDDDDRSLPGAHIDGGPFRDAVTDAQGRVRADDVATGTYIVRVRAPAERDLGDASVHTLHVQASDADAPPGDDGELSGAAPQIIRIRSSKTRKR